MPQFDFKRTVRLLLTGALVLPIAICILLAAARLLAAMQDLAGSTVLERIALAAGLLWLLNLVVLVVSLGLQSLGFPPDEPPGDKS